MARQITKPAAVERNRRTQERLRKKEIEDVPTDGGSGTPPALDWIDTFSGGPESVGSPAYAIGLQDIVFMRGAISILGSGVGHYTYLGSVPSPPENLYLPAVAWIGNVDDHLVTAYTLWIQAGAPGATSGVLAIRPDTLAAWGDGTNGHTLALDGQCYARAI